MKHCGVSCEKGNFRFLSGTEVDANLSQKLNTSLSIALEGAAASNDLLDGIEVAIGDLVSRLRHLGDDLYHYFESGGWGESLFIEIGEKLYRCIIKCTSDIVQFGIYYEGSHWMQKLLDGWGLFY